MPVIPDTMKIKRGKNDNKALIFLLCTVEENILRRYWHQLNSLGAQATHRPPTGQGNFNNKGGEDKASC